MNRCFFITYRTFLGEVGGGRGVIYRLFLANKKYNMIPESYYCFTDLQLKTGDALPDIPVVNDSPKKNNRFKVIEQYCKRFGVFYVLKHRLYCKGVKDYLKSLNLKYHFRNTDCYIFHDIESCVEFRKLFSFKKTILVYHQQGNLYYSKIAIGMHPTSLYHYYLNKYVANGFNTVSIACFPSIGAKDSFFESDKSIDKIIHKRDYGILYNGFAKPEVLSKNQNRNVETAVNELISFRGLKFISVSALNDAKGVERIPSILGKVSNYYDIKWVLIGNGPNKDKVNEEIKINHLETKCIWIKEPLSHDEVLTILNYTDIYFMLHRFSIFDYATLEAMAYGNIPLLSDVGGNREVIIDNNGLLIKDIKDIDVIIDFIKKSDFKLLKQKNISTYKKNFNDKVFLLGYKNQIQKLENRI